MKNTEVQTLLDDLRFCNPSIYELATAIRAVIHATAPSASEEVKYGGLLFTSGESFCGVFAYAGHVSVEFSRGCDLHDDFGVLEGKGKFRRHIKILAVEEIQTKHVSHYVAQAFQKVSSSQTPA